MITLRGLLARFPLHRYALHAGRWTWYVSAALLFLAAAVLLVLRLWLPSVSVQTELVARLLSEKSGQVVRLEHIEPYWRGLHPGLRLLGVEVYAPGGTRAAVRLQEIRASVAWLPLLRGRIEAKELTLVQPQLALERTADGRFKLFGLEAQSPTPEEGGEERFVARLFAQKEINVEDGMLRWIDRKSHSPPLTLSHVNITLRNSGSRHRFGMSAAFPPGMCRDCSVIADISGNPLRLEAWRGQVYVRAVGVDIQAFPAVVRERFAKSLGGVFDAQLWSDWADARPRSIHGQIAASAMHFPDTAWASNLAVRQASAHLDWERTAEGWRLSLREPRLALEGRAWSPEQIDLEFAPSRSVLSIAHVQLDDLAWLAARVNGDHPVIRAVLAMRPRGSVDRISARIDGPLAVGSPFNVDADVSEVRTEPYEHIPGVRGISGHVYAERDRGEATLSSDNGELNFARVFAAPISIGRASGHVRWERRDDRWYVAADRLQARSRDGRADGKLEVEWPFDRSVSPVLRVQARGSDLDVAQAPHYYPMNVTSERLRAWLRESIGGGTVTSASVDLDGPIREFPFRTGSGHFEVHAHVINGQFNYLNGWEPIRRADAELLFRGAEMLVTGEGKMRGLDVQRVVVHAPDLHAPDGPVVTVSGAMAGPAQDTLAVLRDRPTSPGQVTVPAGLAATGNGVLGLDIVIPVRHPHDFTLHGEYQFDNNLLAWGAIHAKGLAGTIGFTHAGLRNGELRARVFGGDMRVMVTPSPRDADRAQRIEAQGTVTQAGLVELWPDLPAGIRLVKPAPWSVQVSLDPTPHLRLQGDLTDLEAAFPPPLDKVAGSALPLVLTTESATTEGQVLSGSLGGRAAARVQLSRRADGWGLAGAHLVLGGSAPPSGAGGSGVWVSLATPSLDIDRWLQFLRQRPASGGSEPWPAVLTRASATVGEVKAFGRRFSGVTLDLQRRGNGWDGGIDSREVAGNVSLVPPDRRRADPAVVLRLARLIVPAADTKAPPRPANADGHAPRWPRLNVLSDELQVGAAHLGRLELIGAPSADGFRVERLALTRPEMTLEASGQWQGTRPRSSFQGTLKTNDIGQTLSALNLPNQVDNGRAEVSAQLNWLGTPTDFDLTRISGTLRVDASKGSFVQVKQGAGRLLGLFDVRSLTRYLSLDFSSLFGKGFAFDQVRGNIAVEDGDARTNDLAIVGPSASLFMEGRTGLARKDFDLKISVEPHLRDNITVAGAILGGPVGAGAAWVMQRLLRKPIAASTRMVYIVQGPWENPTVQRVGHRAQPDAASP